MIRSACAVLGVAALFLPVPPDADAVAFARAFKSGHAEPFMNRQVSGTGVSFHGPIQERIADGSARTSLVVTLGSDSAPDHLTLLKTWADFVAAEQAQATLTIALSGPNLPDVPASPATITFSGVYDGQVRTVMRPPQARIASAAGNETSASRPCPGEQTRQPETAGVFYCAPLLTGATATIVPQ